MQPKVELAKIRDFGEIISDTFLFIRQNIKPLLKYFFTFCGIFVAGGIVCAALYQLKWAGTMNSLRAGAFNTNQYKPSPFSFFGPEYFLLILFGILSFTALTVTFLSYIALYKEKGKQVPTTEEMWGYIKYYFLRVLGSSILLHILLIFASLLCGVPGIYLSPIFALIFPIMVIENASFGYAFSRSFFLIKDNWWVTFGALVVIWIIFYVAIVVITIPTTIINMISLITAPQKGGAAFSAPAAIIGAALQQLCQVFGVLPVTALALCYFNLTESKDGTSLMDKINKLGTTTPNTDLPAEEY
ncbi:hypothetical protein [Mucilaginibacter sp. SG564]|uniref:hypothetical protein n=1 Tax=unclassified Mucilaginibacter TaxID=2617802 RepID=UPI001555A75C|nr:hypothetical protein [Mucilaginibacter sp. SG564]NOW98155.1 hypothetical protein [Mucilaginibacter sp. SG564]